MRAASLLAYTMLPILAGTGCSADAAIHPGRLAGSMAQYPVAGNTEIVTIIGVRMTSGNAVDCPVIKTDDGREQPVDRLPASVAIGQRVRVTGQIGVSTRCTGRVLIIESHELLKN